MIHTASTAVATSAMRVTTLMQQAAGLPVHLVRKANSVILAGPVPTVTPSAPPGSAKVLTVLGWFGWGVFTAAITGVLQIFIKMALAAHRNRGGDGGGEEAGKLVWPLLACIVGSSAGAILGVVA